jgi:hypothetical protein
MNLRRLFLSIAIIAVGLGIIGHPLYPGVVGIREVTRGGVIGGPPEAFAS